MKVKRCLAFVLAAAVALSCVFVPAYAANNDVSLSAEDYGTVTENADGSKILNFGTDSITTSGRGEIITDSANNVKRPDNLRTDGNDLAVLTLPAVDLNGSGYDKVDIYAGNRNTTKVTVKVGDTEVAVIENVNTGGDNSAWTNFQTFTGSLSTTSASGNVTLNISGVGANTYCGNYIYVRFYNSGAPVVTNPPAGEQPTQEPAASATPDTAYPYTITGSEFDADGKLNVTYAKNDGAPESAVLFAASYTDASESTMIETKNVSIDGTGSQKIDISKPDTGIVKVFIWDGTSLIKPLSSTKKTAINISNGDPIYMDTSYSFEERAADLVSRMTLEEKVSQIGYKAAAVERLGVKAYDYWKEALHGVARQGKATSFPTALSMSNTWNRDLIFKMADITSTEARAKNNRYNLSYWSPTINMARDPRWGRNEETYGEDPYLTGQIGAAFVKGMQGDDPTYLKTIATLKHFAANNNETNRSGGSSMMTEFNFRNYYTRVFQNVTEEVMPASVMSSYNATTISRNGEYIYNFIPSLANSYLLQDLLRRNWGFDGYVTSDCGAGQYMANSKPFQQGMLGSAANNNIEKYVAEFFKNGLNVECNLSGGNWSTQYGVAAVENGYLSEQELERAVYELFLQRFRTGEFDEGATYQDIKSDVIESDDHVAVAEEVAEESWVLLKNDNNALPLNNSVSNVAVVGSFANKLLLGDYMGTPTKTVTPIKGIREQIKTLNSNAEVTQLGVVSDEDALFNVKSITFVLKNGKTRSIDISKAKNVTGMTQSGGVFTDVTQKASAVIENVDFNDVEKVRVEMSTGSRIGGSLNITYGQGGPTFAVVPTTTTSSNDEYVACEFECGENADDYSAIKELCITASPKVLDFSVENYKAQLDAADVIIAYAGTAPKQSGEGELNVGTQDSSESKDRSNINLPASQAHVQAICNAYPDKTIVVMSTVGQINVEPFMNKCKAILWTSYNGQTQGTALGKVLTGEVNPSGRLTATWYKNEDISKMELYNSKSQTIGGIAGNYTNYDIQADGTNPGHTYQYYSGTPIYPFGYGMSYTSFEYSNAAVDKTSVDANGTVKFTVDVKNTGSKAGKEVVQLYVAHPNAGEDNMPKKQLKGFVKTGLLQPGETEKVEIELNVRDMYMFSEKDQKDVVPAGKYTAYIAKDANDTAISKTFEVTGTLASTLKTVKAIPSGVSVSGLIREDGTALEAETTINANLSAVMSDEVWVDLSKADVKYESSNTSVAKVDKNGVVSSGEYEGVAVITCTVTVGGETKSTTFPIVNKLEIKPSTAEVNAALAELKAAYDKLPKAAYSAGNWAEIEKIYSHGIDEINGARTKSELGNIVAQKINNMNSVALDNLTEKYSLSSVNEAHIQNGTIDYREGGIPMFSGAAGTITNASPYSEIQMQAKDESGNAVDVSKFVWQIKKFDNSVRKVADIDSETGRLTVYGNGIVQITAANVEEMTCGTLMVHINMQIEGEYADEANGANLDDAQSGSSGGKDAGSTADAWMEYKSVKLSNLESIIARYAGKNAGTINISLAKNADAANLIASVNAAATGGWSSWSDAELNLNTENLYNAQINGLLDEYGCATIYIQTNGTNLDYFRLNYIENNDEEPYTINKTLNKTNGRVKVTLGYRGSALAADVVLAASVLNADGTVKSSTTTTAKGAGEFEIITGAAEGETVRLVVQDAGGKALSQPTDVVWKAPVPSTMVLYSVGDSKYASIDAYTYADGLSSTGGWASIDNKSGTYTYMDVNEEVHEYKFTKGLKGGAPKDGDKTLYFTPTSNCKVTAVFMASTERNMNIKYGDKVVTANGIGDKLLAAVSMEVTSNTGEFEPVYVYGGGSNKHLLGIIVEYYGTAAAVNVNADENEDNDRPVQFTTWGGTEVVLTKNDLTGESKVKTKNILGTYDALSTGYFYESDVPYSYDDTYVINKLAVYKDRLYAGCDNGLVIVFTNCMKCYKLKKAADIDIKDMSISADGVMTVTDGTVSAEIPMSAIGGDSIEADEAYVLAQNGAVLVDVRTAEEYAEKSVEGSVNIPVDSIATGLAQYSTDTALIFYCSAGTRAETATEKAKAMGFTNVYNLGSIDKLI